MARRVCSNLCETHGDIIFVTPDAFHLHGGTNADRRDRNPCDDQVFGAASQAQELHIFIRYALKEMQYSQRIQIVRDLQ